MPGLSERLPPIRKSAAGGLFLLFLLLAWTAQAGSLSVVGQSRWVEVRYVIDGDTFVAKNGTHVRLLGINTPEIAHDREPGQPYGQEAKRRLTELIGGQVVQLFTDKDSRDDYGRLLAEVYLRDGTWINDRLVREGFAHVYTFPPNFRWTTGLLQAEAEARDRRLGIWATGRFGVLQAADVNRQTIGQFRVVEGRAMDVGAWRFRLGSLVVSVPRKYRQWFAGPLRLADGQPVRIRATIRASSGGSSSGGLFAAIHSPYDLEANDMEKPQ